MQDLLKKIYENRDTFTEAIIMSVKEEELCKKNDFFVNKEEMIGQLFIEDSYYCIDSYGLATEYAKGKSGVPLLKKSRANAIEKIGELIREVAFIDKAIESEGYWEFCKMQVLTKGEDK